MNHWIRFTPALLAGLLAACAQLPQVRHGEIILDTERQLLCFNAEIHCRSLGLIIANRERNRILEAYGQDPWNGERLDSIAELKQLLLEPPQGGYEVERLGPSRYRLPVNDRTYTVWQVLDDEHRNRYCDPGEFNC